MSACGVCDNERVIAVATGPRTNFIPCPGCCDVDPTALTSEERDDAIAMCEHEGVKPRWTIKSS